MATLALWLPPLLQPACAVMPTETETDTKSDSSTSDDSGDSSVDTPTESTPETGETGTGDSDPDSSDTSTAPPETGTDTDTGAAGSLSFVAEDVAALKLTAQAGDSYVYNLSMDAAGDVDGDGVVDVVINLADRFVSTTPGAYFLVSGTVRGQAEVGAVGAAIYTPLEQGSFGYTASSAGDVDGDGVAEFMVADQFHDADASTEDLVAGAVWLFDGPLSGEVATTEATAYIEGEESPDFGRTAGDNTGRALGAAGDTDGDGYDDILITTLNTQDGYAIGAVFLVTGPIAGELSLPTAAALRINPTNNGYLYGGDQAGDVNGDGLADILAIQPLDDEGAVVIVHGGTTGEISASDADISFDRADADAISGYEAHGIGDLNEDGYADLGFGDYADDRGGTAAGAIAVHLGPFSASEALGAGDAAWIGTERSSMWRCEAAGDVDGDGHPDLAIGASDGVANGPGNVYIELGPIHSGVGDASDADITIAGSDQDMFGTQLASAGDVDADGLADLYVSAPGDDDGGDQSGAVFLILGSSLR